jgi:hypothetical protein
VEAQVTITLTTDNDPLFALALTMRTYTVGFLVFTAALPLEDAIPAPVGSEDEITLPIRVGR